MLQKVGVSSALLFGGGRHRPCAAPLFRLEAFGVPILFRDVLPPVEGRAPFFLRPRGTAPVVRLAVCCFWPAIGFWKFCREALTKATVVLGSYRFSKMLHCASGSTNWAKLASVQSEFVGTGTCKIFAHALRSALSSLREI